MKSCQVFKVRDEWISWNVFGPLSFAIVCVGIFINIKIFIILLCFILWWYYFEKYTIVLSDRDISISKGNSVISFRHDSLFLIVITIRGFKISCG